MNNVASWIDIAATTEIGWDLVYVFCSPIASHFINVFDGEA